MAFEPFFAAGISPFVWARLYSHTDRRQIFSTMGEPSVDAPAAPAILPKDGAMLLRLSTFPIAPDHPSSLRGDANCSLAMALKDATQLPDACFAFYGAVWHPKQPTWLRIATLAMIRPNGADVYAQMLAETKPGSTPVLLECLQTLEPPTKRRST